MKIDKWTGKGHNLLWSNAANWSTGEPAMGQDVLFTGSTSLTLDLAGVEPQLGELTILGDAVTVPDARINLDAAPPMHGTTTDLVIGNNGSLILTDDSILAATNTIQVGSFINGTVTAGTLSLALDSGGWSNAIQIYDGLFSLSGAGTDWGFSGEGTDFAVQVGGPGAELVISNGATLSAQDATNSYLYAGDGATGNGQVLVTGAGSNLTIDQIYLGDGYDGTLTVQNGATVNVGGLFAGQFGDGAAVVTGDAVLSAAYGIVIGGEVPVASSLDITNHGSVYAGTNGLELEEGTLVLDPTVNLFGTIISLGGRIQAQAAPDSHGGTVTLGQGVGIGNWYEDQEFGNVTFVSSTGGAVLNFAGQLQAAESNSILAVTGGTVELSNSQNMLSEVSAFNGTLLVAESGALGTATVSFAYPTETVTRAATLLVASGVAFTNTIVDIGNRDVIDLRGFAFSGGVTDSFANGTLTLNNGAAATSLLIAGNYTAAEFSFTADPHGGTDVHFHKG